MDDTIKQMIGETYSDHREFKDDIVLKRLKDLNIDVDFEKEPGRLFKTVISVLKDNIETWYYNDGSEQGLRIVAFENVSMGFDEKDITDFKIAAQIKYY